MSNATIRASGKIRRDGDLIRKENARLKRMHQGCRRGPSRGR